MTDPRPFDSRYAREYDHEGRRGERGRCDDRPRSSTRLQPWPDVILTGAHTIMTERMDVDVGIMAAAMITRDFQLPFHTHLGYPSPGPGESLT